MHVIIHGFQDFGWKNGEHVYSGSDLLEAHRICAARAGEFKRFGRVYAPQFIPFTPQAAAPAAATPAAPAAAEPSKKKK